MIVDWWSLVRFLHVVAAIVWVGGQSTLSLIVRPAGRAVLGPERTVELLGEVGRRFGRVSLLVLAPILVATGIALAWHRGVTFGALSIPGYGATLGTKVLLAGVAFALAAVHGVMAARASSATSRALGIAGVLVSVAVVLLATALVP